MLISKKPCKDTCRLSETEELQFIPKEQIDAQILAFLRTCERPAHYETIMKAVNISEMMIGERLLVLAHQGHIWENPHQSFSIK